MKILAILNDDSAEQQPNELMADLQQDNQVETISLADGSLSYDEIVDKIEGCDKVISW